MHQHLFPGGPAASGLAVRQPSPGFFLQVKYGTEVYSVGRRLTGQAGFPMLLALPTGVSSVSPNGGMAATSVKTACCDAGP